MRKYLGVVFPQQDCEKGHKIQLRRLPASWSPPIILLAAFLPQLWLTLCPLWGREGALCLKTEILVDLFFIGIKPMYHTMQDNTNN